MFFFSDQHDSPWFLPDLLVIPRISVPDQLQHIVAQLGDLGKLNTSAASWDPADPLGFENLGISMGF